MRGKDRPRHLHTLAHRITPAYAGKSYRARSRGTLSKDHPRVCGEKQMSVTHIPYIEGSPPRMRGKAIKIDSLVMRTRITPAYAGKRHGLAVLFLLA